MRKPTVWLVLITKTNQPAQIRSLICVFVVHMKKLCIIGYPKCALWRFAQTDLNRRWEHVPRYVFWRSGPFDEDIIRGQCHMLYANIEQWDEFAQSYQSFFNSIFINVYWRSGPSCSKLTISLVNDSLKFKLSGTQICWNFLLKKCD